jgi:hypothetical protein
MEQPDQTYESLKDSLYVIKPGDELYITVTTPDNEPNSFSIGSQGDGLLFRWELNLLVTLLIGMDLSGCPTPEKSSYRS